ncbi:hypothetical protein GLOIN_2v1740504 [Rhizophagus irregularis DAOM 181602=DAOM 197198]|uniref:Uncharacterized protein n=1 Tax=Rhizophagus irregularis (strain DAOM 181602 / DAOM 197198 / MUCL 43194) TaxID=747089 RepID=A0A2P4NK63_RHIID|nr:hypothetical protein GLOIN_2v1740504 [Rhizophagus irregularis DAOM 181602=DAOM 197198]POG53518.1 hypothetical protein GLOIN_2v1740504 [Rhizophagus irregularis DAOM 181602=DAOM 197198]|eukprot:XP_025164125.1 hypothetical protein GLOIN_2v1740504 [Rhizophagus irregularis DAOM 181602=DAOM 197198]
MSGLFGCCLFRCGLLVTFLSFFFFFDEMKHLSTSFHFSFFCSCRFLGCDFIICLFYIF